jgi:hypothetical protein
MIRGKADTDPLSKMRSVEVVNVHDHSQRFIVAYSAKLGSRTMQPIMNFARATAWTSLRRGFGLEFHRGSRVLED